jgi:hypothetical protein
MNAVNAAPKKRDPRTGLRMSTSLATVFTILGHTVFGFEQPVSQIFIALAVGYSCAMLFEWVDARANHVEPGYAGGGFRKLVDFLLPAHMTSITLSFLLYFGERVWIMAFAVALALGSKYVLRVPQNGRLQHFMNPSNFGIAVVLVIYQWTGVLPWGFTVNLHGAWDWIIPLIIVGLGTRLNLFFTGRVPTIVAWLGAFFMLAAARSWIRHSPLASELVVLTGIPLVLFTFYMITDPQTSPSRVRSQILLGAGIAVGYHVLLALHVQYMMFYSVTIVCALRGLGLFVVSLREPELAKVHIPPTAVAAHAGAAQETAASTRG